MADAIVIYHSRMGDTRQAAEAIAHGLDDALVEAVWNARPEAVARHALIVLGSGVYLGRPAKELLEFLAGLPPARPGQKAAIFTVSWALDGGAIGVLRAILEKKGYQVVSQINKRRWILGISDDDKQLVEFGRALARYPTQ